MGLIVSKTADAIKPDSRDFIDLQIYFNRLTNTTRTLRFARTFLHTGRVDRVLMVGFKEDGTSDREVISPGLDIVRISVNSLSFLPWRARRILGVLLWSLRMIWRFRKIRCRSITAHSLAALPAAVALSKLTGGVLFYDAHELETERNQWSKGLKRVARFTERRLISYTNEVIVVSDLIADWYRVNYELETVTTIRNLPETTTNAKCRTGLLRTALDLPQDAFLVLYQGRIGPGRGLDMVLRVFEQMPRDFHLVLMGPSGMGPWFEAFKSRRIDAPNIQILPPVDPDELVDYTADADVGLCLIEDTCLSYRYCLPNKLFEYMHAGVYVIASDLPELRDYITRLKAGTVIPICEDALRNALFTARNVPRPSIAEEDLQELSWQEEKKVLRAKILQHF
jgi:glycosyltransferase involved in cell wall biosynthesis